MRILLMGAIPGVLLGIVFLVAQVRRCSQWAHVHQLRFTFETPLLLSICLRLVWFRSKDVHIEPWHGKGCHADTSAILSLITESGCLQVTPLSNRICFGYPRDC